MAENTSFADPSRVVYRGSHGHRNPPGTQKSWVIRHENDKKWPKTRVLPISLESCTGGHRASKSSCTRKSWDITHENDQKKPKTRDLPIPLESCTGGHRASKSPRDPKIVGSNPRKQPEMLEIMSFADPTRVVYRWSQGIEILLGLENHGL